MRLYKISKGTGYKRRKTRPFKLPTISKRGIVSAFGATRGGSSTFQLPTINKRRVVNVFGTKTKGKSSVARERKPLPVVRAKRKRSEPRKSVNKGYSSSRVNRRR